MVKTSNIYHVVTKYLVPSFLPHVTHTQKLTESSQCTLRLSLKVQHAEVKVQTHQRPYLAQMWLVLVWRPVRLKAALAAPIDTHTHSTHRCDRASILTRIHSLLQRRQMEHTQQPRYILKSR